VEAVDPHINRRHLLLDNYHQLQQRIDKYQDLCWETVDDIFVLLDRLAQLKSPSDPMLKTLCIIQQRHLSFLMENVTRLNSLQAILPPIHRSMMKETEDPEYLHVLGLLNIS
jgi:hypothetical protein